MRRGRPGPHPNLIDSLVQDGLATPAIDTGLRRFGAAAVTNVDYSVLAAGLIADSIPQPRDHRRKPSEPEEPYRLLLAEEVNPTEAALWLGRAVVKNYGSGFATIEVFRAAISDETTAATVAEIDKGHQDGLFSFVFMVEQDSLTDEQDSRVVQIYDRLHELALPVMSLMHSELGDIEPGAETPTTEHIVSPQFTLDTRLVYPLILRRTSAEPATDLS